MMITSSLRLISKLQSPCSHLAYFFCLSALFSSAGAFAQEIRFVGEDTIPLLYENEKKLKVGAMVELAQALSAYTGLKSKIEILPWARAYETALTEPNVVLLSALKTPLREPELRWIGKVLEAEANLIGLTTRTDIKINNLDDAKDYIVASVRGYGSARYLLRQGFSEKYNLILTSHQSQIWRLLFSKRVDLVVANLKFGQYEAEHLELDPAMMHSKFQILELKNELHFAAGRVMPEETAELLQQGLTALKQNGSYEAILKKWGLR